MKGRTSRAGFLAAAAGLVAAGCGGPTHVTLVGTPLSALDDAAIGRILASTELLSIDLYERTAVMPGLSRVESRYMKEAAENERAHHAAISLVLGSDVPHRLRFDYPQGTFATTTSAIRTGVALERAALGAYLGAVSEVRDTALRSLASRIAANEAQHLQGLMSIDSPGIDTMASIPAVLTAREAAGIVAPFLA